MNPAGHWRTAPSARRKCSRLTESSGENGGLGADQETLAGDGGRLTGIIKENKKGLKIENNAM